VTASRHALSERLARHGYFTVPIELPPVIREKVVARDWPALDQAMRKELVPGGTVFDELSHYARFTEIEFIISIRSSIEFPDDDGIWHDDGSRLLAFSLSVSLEHLAVEGGLLEIRRRDAPDAAVEGLLTPAFGTLIVFATGQSGFEHKINRVTRGERIIIAGWCT
jgi:hypothetical protein